MELCHHFVPIYHHCDSRITNQSNTNFNAYGHEALPHNNEYDFSAQQFSTAPYKQNDMKTAVIRPTIKRHRDLFSDHYDLPLKRSCRHEGTIEDYGFNESPRQSPTFCKMLTVRNLDGVEKSLEIDDLVDMVMQVTKNLDEADLAQQILHITKRRQQNKMAAARYRDKQKERKHILLKEQAELEEKNAKLKEMVRKLESEVADYKGKLVQIMSDLSITRI